MTDSADKTVQKPKKWGRIAGIALTAVLACGALVWGASQWTSGSSTTTASTSVPTYTAQKGNLTVTVSAGGTVQAMETTEVKSKVEGQTQILEIIDQGTILTEEDVENERVIVRLDSSSLEDQEEQQEIEVANAEAAYTSAKESLNIQKQQNESNISQAELKVEFARMDLEKYVGRELAGKIINGNIDYDTIGERESLGGEAQVEKENLQSQIDLARERLTRAQDTLNWTKKLVEKGYVNRNEQDADELQLKSRRSELQQAQANLRLFLEYSLPKQAETYASDLREAKRELTRVEARARSQLAQAESELRTKESTYQMKKQRLEELRTMIDNCTIEAPKPGLIVYASTSRRRRFDENPIEEGREIREGQTIITIPNLETMSAKIAVPESDIQSVEEGMRASVSVGAIPEETWEGEVAQVASMASEQDRFGPDISVYETFVKLDGRVTKLKPGMSATAEIYAAELEDVLTVPVQAITTYRGSRVVWTSTPDGLSLRQVRTGTFSDTKVEIQEGLEEGDKVLLAAPEVEPSDVRFVELPGDGATKVAQKSGSSGPGKAPAGRGAGGSRKGRPGGGAPPQSGRPGGGGRARKDSPRGGRPEGSSGGGEEKSDRGRGRGMSPGKMDADTLAQNLQKMPAERRKKVLKRIRQNMSSMPEEKRRKMQKVLDRFQSDGADKNDS
ncbi:MAG: efflux RND transporter periplasmic adaptor subunit [Planctomycetota bacterium]